MHYLLLFIFLILPVSSYAQSDDAFAQLCEHVSAKKSMDSAEYVPGVDVHGNPVVSADLSAGGSVPLNNPVVLPINIDLAKRYGLNLPLGMELEPNIANMVLFSDGRIIFGNEDVTASIESFCKSPDAQAKKNQSNQAEQHGHESANPVLSTDKIEGQYPED